ncbi:MAG: asparagine synthase-related protein [Acidobacteriota bacterium]|nr:asparagine synthase-related protein [Acidobacteriota bacterium]
MNAVAAVFGAADQQLARVTVATMLARMRVRAAGRRVDGAEGLTMLAASGRDPALSSRAGHAILAGDLRLDNRRELLSRLGLASGTADADIALEAYLRWGVPFAREFAGAFTLLIADRREGRLVAVRDHLGIRPLHYRGGASGVRVASELQALVESGDRLNEGFLAEVLSGDIVDRAGTAYEAISRVPPGHVLIADTNGARVVRYWEPSTGQHDGSAAEHAERLREAFDEAVRAATDGHDSVGVHVSGGLDSSSVIGTVAANRFAEPIAGSYLLPWPEADERRWIDATCARWGIAPLLLEPPIAPARHDLDAIARHGDLPDHPSGGPLLSVLHDALRAHTSGPILTGMGGDQWWSGEKAHLADLVRAGRASDVAAWRAAGPAMGQIAWSWPNFVRDGLVPLVPAAARRAVRRVRPLPPPPWIDRGFAARTHLLERKRSRPQVTRAPSESWRRQRWRLDSGEEAIALERVDRHAVAAGVDLRHPFYDRRLVELAFATPDTARISGGRNRAVLRDAMADRLAPEVRARDSKADPTQLLICAARDPAIAPHLSLPVLSQMGWIDAAASARIVEQTVRDGDPDAVMNFWYLVGVEAWLRETFGAR